VPRLRAPAVLNDAALEDDPVFGAPLAPAPTDLEQMMAVEAPVDEVLPIEQGVDDQFAGTMSRFTSTEAIKAGANRIGHVHSPMRTLYDHIGNDREVTHGDVPMLVDQSLPEASRLYIRCPLCVSMPNRGFHKNKGPNGCPGRPARKWMQCPICAVHGRKTIIWEGHAPSLTTPESQQDANFVQPHFASAQDRDQQLQNKLENHMTAFHEGESADKYGLRRRIRGQ
jgi:hypothetical protein